MELSQLSANLSQACASPIRVARASLSWKLGAISKQSCARRRYSSALLVTLAAPVGTLNLTNARGEELFRRIRTSVVASRAARAAPRGGTAHCGTARLPLPLSNQNPAEGGRARTYRWTRMRRSHALSRPLAAYSAAPPVPYLRAWQDMSLSESPSTLGAVSRFAPRMLLLNPISTERSLYLS
jgi:hypothetical protein